LVIGREIEMARFDWKAAIIAKATEVEGLLMCAADPMWHGVPHIPAKQRAEASRYASYAEWIARSYCRKGRKP
jgi:hypothetical protein